ncbi:MAG: hypothetical protein ACP5N1_03985 [Candidatus Woesearchaeota archaeon]
MLDSQITNKIEEFVYPKPRTIQEIAHYIQKNWRTADRYVDEIEKNFGTISVRVFRGGTKGALKIVYWSSVEKVSHSIFQEKLGQDIMISKNKEDFSAFDIFQYVPDSNKTLFIENIEEKTIDDFSKLLLTAKKQVLFFSGNLSFINLKNKKNDIFKILENLLKNNVSIKILCRVDFAGQENIERVLSLNLKYGKNIIEIRHDSHPIRGVIIDGKIMRLKEIKEPTGKTHELNRKLFIYYTINDKNWAEWLSKIFWKKFSNSMDANKRLEQLKKIKIR